MYVRARLTALFFPAGGGEPITLVRHGVDLLLDAPAESLTLPSDDRVYCDRMWAETVPTGNAALTLSLNLLCEYLTVGQLEANIRERQLAMATCRHGELELHEGYHQGVPSMRTRWQACCVGLDVVKLLPQDDALGVAYAQPTLKGRANGQISYTWRLWAPKQV